MRRDDLSASAKPYLINYVIGLVIANFVLRAKDVRIW